MTQDITARANGHLPYCLHAEDWGETRVTLVDLRASQQRIESSIETFHCDMQATLRALEARVRAGEDYRNKQLGAMAVVGAICGVVGAAIVKVVTSIHWRA